MEQPACTNRDLRDLWSDYRSEVFFGVVLSGLVIFSFWAASFIPEDIFENFINPAQYVSFCIVCFYGAWILYRHNEGNALRVSWGRMLLVWGIIELILIVLRYGFQVKAIGGTPDDPLFNASVTLGNILAFMLYIYPTRLLRPGWLTWWRAALFLLPMIVLGVVDYYGPVNLLSLIMVYPAIIFLMLCRHVRKYRQWCEDNFSTMDDIDVQWIVRYLTMLFIAGVAFYFIAYWYVPNRMFTQQWTLFLILAYTTERVLFRPDPWEEELKADNRYDKPASESEPVSSEYVPVFEQWMDSEKPYVNANFRLQDIRQVLPMNRTYLSQFIKAAYNCSFYQLVNRYRIEEAKRLLREKPDMKMVEVAHRTGFSSATVFSRIFGRETGMPPSEWVSKNTAS